MDKSSEDENKPKTSSDEDSDSLESSTTAVVESDSADSSSASNNEKKDKKKEPKSGESSVKRILSIFNIYLLIFVLLLIVAGVVGTLFYLKNQQQADKNNATPSQTLSQSDLDQLANSDVTVGAPKQVLNVQSNAVFAGKVLIRDNLEIAGSLQVGGNMALQGIRVTGNSTFDDVQITKSLSLTGNGSVQGQLNVGQALNVNGNGTFKGSLSAAKLTVGSFELSGDLNVTRHVTAGGGTPSRTSGNALGSGGTATVGGSDTAGSITVNTGGSPGAGCFITVNFVNPFNTTPHIVITPVGAGAAQTQYYINRTTANFSVCTASAPPANASFGFDYIAFD